MANEGNTTDSQIRLYSLLVDQIHKYTTIFWQFPTALAAVNFLALHNHLKKPILVLVVFFFDTILIYSFCRMVRRQREIITVARNAEEKLREDFPLFVPRFDERGWRAPVVTVWSLWVLDASLLIWDVVLFGRQWTAN